MSNDKAKRYRSSENHPFAKLTNDAVKNLCEDYRKGWTLREVSENYGVSINRVWMIVNGYAWQEVTGGVSISRGAYHSIPRETAIKIRRDYMAGDLQRVIAQRYGVTQSQVSAIVSWKTHKKDI